MKKRIPMLATGGTIASRESGQGLAPAITSGGAAGLCAWDPGSCAGWRPSS